MPSAEFTASIFANLNYWWDVVQKTDERQYSTLLEDWSNIYRAIQFGLGLPAAGELIRDLIIRKLGRFIERGGHWGEWLLVLDILLTRRAQFPVREQALLLEKKGDLLRLTRHVSEAIEVHHRAEALMRQAGDDYQIARLSHALSEDYFYQRNYSEAGRWGLVAWDLFDKLGLIDDPGKGGAVLNTLGQIAYAQGDYDLAEERLRMSIQLGSRIDAPTEQARLLNNLGRTLQAAGRFAEALEQLTAAAELLEQTNSELDKVEVEMSLGTLYASLEDWQAATAAFRKADSQFLKQSGHTHYRALLANNLGNVLMEQGLLSEAEMHLRSGIRLWRQTEDQVMLANTLGSLGETLAKLGQFDEACQVYQEALLLLKQYQQDAWASHLFEKFQEQLAKVKLPLH